VFVAERGEDEIGLNGVGWCSRCSLGDILSTAEEYEKRKTEDGKPRKREGFFHKDVLKVFKIKCGIS